MKFTETAVPGAYSVEVEPFEDERGLFARTFDAEEFAARGLASIFPQTSASWNRSRGTLRGLHFQTEPHAEDKLIRCTRGRVWAVVADLRPDSPAYLSWAAGELDEHSRRMHYAPKGTATGFVTLEDGCELHYMHSHPYAPEHAAGVRWDDPALGIEWPLEPAVMSERDRSWPDIAG